MTNTFSWSVLGGTWSNGANWNDTSSAVAGPPTNSDTAIIAGPGGSSFITITGPGDAASLTTSGDLVFGGLFNVGTLTNSGTLDLVSGTTLSAATAVTSGGMQVNGGSLGVSGTLTLGLVGSFTATAGPLVIENHGTVRVGALAAAESFSNSISLDSTSVLEIGGAGTAVAGTLTVDTGALMSVTGSIGSAPSISAAAILNDGTISGAFSLHNVVNAGLIQGASSLNDVTNSGTIINGGVSNISGTGLIEIGHDGTLSVGTGVAGTVSFLDNTGTLDLSTGAAPGGPLESTPTIAGLAAGDGINLSGITATAATYAQTGTNIGLLTLANNGVNVATLTLAGNYTGTAFIPTVGTSGANGATTAIALASGTIGAGVAPPSAGTASSDAYAWIAAAGGDWGQAANWSDVTAGTSPAGIAPGINNLVTIAGASGSFQVISGQGDAASLTTSGDLVFGGLFNVGTLTNSGTLDLVSGTTLSAATAVTSGGMQVNGGSLGVSGTLTLGLVGSFTATAGPLVIENHGTVRVGALAAAESFSNSISLDSTSVLEIGGAGTAVAGTLTVDTGALMSVTGSIGSAPSISAAAILNDGTISGAFSLHNVVNAGLIQGASSLNDVTNSGTIINGGVSNISGTGLIEIGHDGTLSVGTGVAGTVSFLDNTGTLDLSTGAAPGGPLESTPTIAGLAAGDGINLSGITATAATYAQTGTNIGLLTLANNGVNVATLTLAGNYTGTAFIPTVGTSGANGATTAIALASGTIGAGVAPPSAGTASSDAYAWIAAAGGDWGQAANWSDVTAGTSPAGIAPGINNLVTIAGASGSFQVISGQGDAASLTTSGDLVFGGLFNVGTLTNSGTLDLVSGTTLSAATAVTSGGMQVNGGSLGVSGTLTLGLVGSFTATAGPLVIENHGTVRVGALAAAESFSNSISLDSTSVLEIGGAGTAVAGTLTVDTGALMSVTGSIGSAPSISAAAILNDGTISGAFSLHNVVNAGLIQGASSLNDVTNSGTIINGGVSNISGTGLIEIGHDGTLSVGTGVAGTVSFLDNTGTLDLSTGAAPGGPLESTPTIAGLAAGDGINLSGITATAATYAQTGTNIGLLTLANNGVNVATLTLAGNYTGTAFIPTVGTSGANGATTAIALENAGTVVTIASGATLQIPGTIPAGKSVAFAQGAPETLILGSPTGTISNPIIGLADGDKIEFSNGINITTYSTLTGGLEIFYTTSGGESGDYMLTDIPAVAALTGYTWGTDPVTNDTFIMPTRFFHWTGASGTNFGTAGNWDFGGVAPGASDYAQFVNGAGGTISGSGSVEELLFYGAGTWSLAPGTSLSAAVTFQVGANTEGTEFGGNVVIGDGSTITSDGLIAIGNNAGATANLTVSGGGVLDETAPGNTTIWEMSVGSNGPSGTLAAASANVIVTGTGSTINLGLNGLELGDNGGDATMTVSHGGSVFAATTNSSVYSSISIGKQGNDTLTVTDAGSKVTAIGDAYLSRSGSGTLIVENSGTFLAVEDITGQAGLTIGSGNTAGIGGTGYATVTADGNLLSQGFIAVGVRGTAGQLAVVNGGTVQVGTTLIVGAGGTIAPGTIETGNGTLTIGANGTVELIGGAQTTAYGAILGNANNSEVSSTTTGVATVSGTGALLNTDGNGLAVGRYGGATLTVSQGGSVSSGSANSSLISALAVGSQGSGTVAVTDATSQFTVNGGGFVGGAGAGSLTVENQGVVSFGLDGLGAGGLSIGGDGTNAGGTLYAGGGGSALVTGRGDLSSAAGLSVGEDGDTGTLTITGGTVSAMGQLLIGASTTLAAGDILITPEGTTTVTTPTEEIGTGSVIIGAGGLLTVDQNGSSATAIALGDTSGSTGALSVTSGGTVIAGGGVSLFQNSTLSIAAGGNISVGGTGTLTATASNETISNLGTISGSVSLTGGDRLITGAGAVFGGAISGGTGSNTLEIATGPYALENFDAAGTPEYTTLQIDNGVSLTIDASDTLTGVTLINAGTLNLTAFEPTAPVQNSGFITGDVTLTSGVPLTNEAGGTISGSGLAVIEALGPASVTNAGVIDTTAYGVDLTEGGTVTNTGPGASISGTIAGVLITGGAGTVITSGAIDGGLDAVTLAAGFANRVILEPGATFAGLVDGGDTIGTSPASTLELASSTGTLTGFGTEFINFAQILVDPNASWVLNEGSLAPGVTLTDQGQLLVSGTTVTGGAVTIASTPGITASGTVSDGAWSGMGSLVVGGAGSGSFLVNNAGTAAAAGLDEASAPGASGVITVTGTQSLLSNTGQFIIGDQGLGSLSITAGGTVTTSSNATIANTGSASGSQITLSGLGSNLAITGTLLIGGSGSGQLSLSQSATVTAGAATIASAAGSAGDVLVTGPSSALNIATTLTVGGGGEAGLSIFAGGLVSALNASIGTTAGATGAIDLEGAGSTLMIGTKVGTVVTGGTLTVGGAGAGEVIVGAGTTLEVASAVNITGSGILNNLGGTIDPDVLTNTSSNPSSAVGLNEAGVYVENTATYTINAGTATFDAPLVQSGTDAGDARTNINNNITANGIPATGFFIIGAGGTLVMNTNSVDAGQVMEFNPGTAANAVLVIGQDVVGGPGVTPTVAAGAANVLGGFQGEIWGFAAGDQIEFANLTVTSDAILNGNTVELFDGLEDLGGLTFFSKSGGTATVASVEAAAAQMACFAAGTRIGGVAVEDLRVGDRVPLAAGGSETIVWVGSRAVECGRHPRPESVWPVRVAAGAFGVGMPGRAVFLSPDHAVFVGGVLVPVRLLVNGGSIVQVKRRRVVYYHVELVRHEVIEVEGLACESYLDVGDRADFGSRTGVVRLYPEFGGRAGKDVAAVWEMKGAAELVTGGVALERVRGVVGGDVRRDGDPLTAVSRTG